MSLTVSLNVCTDLVVHSFVNVDSKKLVTENKGMNGLVLRDVYLQFHLQ